MKKYFTLLILLSIIIGSSSIAQIPTNGLVAFYPFNGNTNDVSGNNLHGTADGATLVSDRFGDPNSSYSFNKSKITVSDNNLLDFTNEFSLCAWYKSNNTYSYLDQGIVLKSRNDNGGGYTLALSNPGDLYGVQTGFPKIGFGINTGTPPYGGNVMYHSDDLVIGWHFIVGTYDGAEIKLYVDGELKDSLLTSVVFPNFSSPLYIGRSHGSVDAPVPSGDTVRYFFGDIDDVKIYNRGLNASEVTALYNASSPVSDVDGNFYNTVVIGTQTWMKENLKTTKYRNGDELPNVTDGNDWSNLTAGAYCDYNNSPSNSDTYGRLYNFYSVADSRNICPTGWHVPSDGEWKTIEMYLGMSQADIDSIGDRGTDQGTQLKSTSGWNSGGNGTNSSGYNALPGGGLDYNGSYYDVGNTGHWWSSSEIEEGYALYRYILKGSTYIYRDYIYYKSYNYGFSVRCLKDSEKEIVLSNLTTKVGETFEVDVSTSELTINNNVTAYQFDYNYDIGKLEYIGSSITGTLVEGGSLEINPTAGKLSIAWANGTAIIGTGAILKLQFKSLSVGETTPTITNALYNTASVTAINGTITAINKYGDIDDNDKVQAYDASLAIQYSVGLDPIPAIDVLPWENWRIITANVDGVGSITANDASEILKYTVGLITQFPVETGKKSASASIADVTVGVVNSDIVFYSSGDLFGLNISTTNINQILGTPSVLIDNFMSAFNINGTTYNLGLCSAYSPDNGVAFMKIPFSKSGSVTFNMVINTEEKTVTVDLVTGKVEFSNDKISIYPNPVKDILKISGLTSPTVMSIYSTNGKLLLTSKLNSARGEINVSDLPVGVYVIKLQTDKEISVKRFAIK